jgi:hypothetical protein
MTISTLLGITVFQFIFPLAFAGLFVTFIWGVFFYMVAGTYDEEAREKAKALMMYAFLGFLVFMFFWWIATMIGNGFGR